MELRLRCLAVRFIDEKLIYHKKKLQRVSGN